MTPCLAVATTNKKFSSKSWLFVWAIPRLVLEQPYFPCHIHINGAKRARARGEGVNKNVVAEGTSGAHIWPKVRIMFKNLILAQISIFGTLGPFRVHYAFLIAIFAFFPSKKRLIFEQSSIRLPMFMALAKGWLTQPKKAGIGKKKLTTSRGWVCIQPITESPTTRYCRTDIKANLVVHKQCSGVSLFLQILSKVNRGGSNRSSIVFVTWS